MKKAQTLQIKQFLGIDRFTSNTLNDPRKFESLKNLDSKNPGELSDVPGSQLLINSALQSSGALFNARKIYHSNFLKKTNGRESLIFATESNYTLNNALFFVNADFTERATSGGTTSHDVMVLYRGLGRTLAYSSLSGINFGNFVDRRLIPRGGVSISATKLAALPLHCCEVVFYARSGSNSFAFIGAFQRHNGVFPTGDLICVSPRVQATGANTIARTPSTTSTISGSNLSGSLIPGRTYYVALAPYLLGTDTSVISSAPATYSNNAVTEAEGQDSGGNLFAVTLGPGQTAIRCFFDGLTNPIAGNNVQQYLVFVGENIEDMYLVGGAAGGSGGGGYNPFDGRVSATVMDYDDFPLSYADKDELTITINDLPQNSSLTFSKQYYDQLFAFDKDKIWDSTGRPPGGLCRFMSCRITTSPSEFVFGTSKTIAWFAVDASSSNFEITATNLRQVMPQINALGYYSAPLNNFANAETAVPNALADLGLEPSNSLANANLSPWRPVETSTLQYNPQSIAFRDRLYVVDNYAQLYYIDGFGLKPVIPDFQTWYAPIAKYISSFKDRLIVGGSSNFTITPATPIYSEVNNPFSFTATPAATPAPNNLFTNSGDNSDLLGFGIYSTNLSTSGPQTFLVIGKETSVLMWNGLTTEGVKEISSNVGWASPLSYALTNLGPLFVGSDANVYALLSDSKIAPIGYAVQPILNAGFLNSISTVFHENNFKIAYLDASSDQKEIWLERRLDDQGMMGSTFKGVHDRNLLCSNTFTAAILNQAVMRNFGEYAISGTSFFKDFRVAAISLSSGQWQIARLDAAGVYSSSAPKLIEMNRLGLEQDHFWKTIKDVYVATEAAANITLSATISGEDATANVTVSDTHVFADGARKLNQMQLASRFLGRVNKLALTLTSTAPFKIFDVSLLFDVRKRRRL